MASAAAERRQAAPVADAAFGAGDLEHAAQVERRRVRFQICAQRPVAAGAEELAQRRLGDDEEDGEGGDRREQAHSDG